MLIENENRKLGVLDGDTCNISQHNRAPTINEL